FEKHVVEGDALIGDSVLHREMVVHGENSGGWRFPGYYRKHQAQGRAQRVPGMFQTTPSKSSNRSTRSATSRCCRCGSSNSARMPHAALLQGRDDDGRIGVARPGVGLAENVEQRLETAGRFAHIVKHLGDDIPPALPLAHFIGAPAPFLIELFLAREGGAKAS